jgi:predicted ATPase/DNA-binding CsgD family transcriptional regulator
MSEHAEGRHAQLRLVSAELSRTDLPRQVVPESPGVRPIRAGNLPFPIASFVGRSAELDRTEGLLAGNRLLTITGSGGCGKTRLAIELARRIQDRFAGGVWLVDLEPLRSADHVLTEIAAALGVEEPERDRTLADAVSSFLSSSSHLVLLDNCEHVTAAAGTAATAMLAGAPGLRILATSREPLVVPGEVTWRIPELDPDDAVALFVERAGQASPDLSLHGARQAGLIRSICRRLDGLPLAIELAAARMRTLSLSRIEATLRKRFDLLSEASGSASRRHATLRASFEWSYELLSPAERELLAELAVFAGEFGIDDALAVCPDATIPALARIADRNLLTIREDGDGELGYRMLQTVRELAAEPLAADVGQFASALRRHAEHYLARAESAEPHLTGRLQDQWLARLAADYANLRTALAWARDEPAAELCARLAVALTTYWLERSQWSECRLWLDAAAKAGPLPAALRAAVNNRRCYLELWAGDAGLIPGLCAESLTLLAGLDEHGEEGRAHGYMGLVAAYGSGPDAARPHMERAFELIRSAGDDWALAMGLAFYADALLFRADPSEPRRMLDEAIEIATAAGDRRTLRLALARAALAAVTQGRLAEASRRAERAADSARQAGHPGALLGALIAQAWTLLLQGNYDAASATAHQCYVLGRESGEGGEGVALWLQAEAALALDDSARARQLLTQARELAADDGVFAALPVLATARALLAAGDRGAAVAAASEAATIARSTGHIWILGRVSLFQARLEDDSVAAEAHVLSAVALSRDAGDTLGLVDAVELLAELAADRGSDEEAQRLWAAAVAARARLGYARPTPGPPGPSRRIDDPISGMTAEDVPAAWRQGECLSIEEALAYASRGRGRRRRPAAGWASLTRTELEVARLVARHLPNPEIAQLLFVSRATVKTHLVHIFAKLGIRSRSELAAEAIRRGLT